MGDKVVKVNESLYEKARVIAEARGIKIGDAIQLAGEEVAPAVSVCEEEGFKAELAKIGVTPPANVRWLFGFLDNFTPEMLRGSKLAPYAEARAKSKGICSLLPGAEEAVEFPEGSGVPVAGVSEEVPEEVPETED